jgi:hypothetical protein
MKLLNASNPPNNCVIWEAELSNIGMLLEFTELNRQDYKNAKVFLGFCRILREINSLL